MPLDQYGRVIVNPNVPLNMQDFQQLYTGQGVSPDQAASQIFLNSPTEGRSYLEDQWSRFNTGSSPEQYFSDPAHAAAQVAIQSVRSSPNSSQQFLPPSGPASTTPAEQWPSFINPLQQKIAQATGQYDPNYASPKAKLESQLDQTIQDQQTAFQQNQFKTSLANAAAAHTAYAPEVDPITGKLSNPNQFLTTQLAGDTSGTVSTILRSLQNQDLSHPLQPYVPQAGYGKLDPNLSTYDPLDHTLYNDPSFRQALIRDPDKASFAYQRLTGRDLHTDLTTSNDFRKKQLDTGFAYAKQAIDQGAKYDPNTGKWRVYNVADAPDAGNSISLTGAAPHPFSQLVPATDEQNTWLNQHYKNVTGRPIPTLPTFGKTAAPMADQLMQDPTIAAAITAKSKELDRTLNPMEKIAIGRMIQKQPTPSDTGGLYQASKSSLDLLRNVIGLKSIPDGYGGENGAYGNLDPSDPNNLNYMGKTVQKVLGALASQEGEGAY